MKYVSLYSFFVAGRTVPGHFRVAEKRCIYALAALPLIFKLIGETKIYTGVEYPDVFSYFPNTNTAALYFSALFFALTPWFGNKVLVLQFINAAVMNRVGPALATIVAVGMWSIFPLRIQVFVGFFLLGARRLSCLRAWSPGSTVNGFGRDRIDLEPRTQHGCANAVQRTDRIDRHDRYVGVFPHHALVKHMGNLLVDWDSAEYCSATVQAKPAF